MERKILFKAKRLDNSEWVEGYYAKYIGMENVKDKEKHLIFGMTKKGTTYWHEVDPSTVCQFTGLKDMDGKEIWEGDIIKNPEFPFEERTVTWVNHQSCFIPMGEDGCQDRDFSFLVLFKEWTVVGNKFDRKEGEK